MNKLRTRQIAGVMVSCLRILGIIYSPGIPHLVTFGSREVGVDVNIPLFFQFLLKISICRQFILKPVNTKCNEVIAFGYGEANRRSFENLVWNVRIPTGRSKIGTGYKCVPELIVVTTHNQICLRVLLAYALGTALKAALASQSVLLSSGYETVR
jgi:hypothetical protein